MERDEIDRAWAASMLAWWRDAGVDTIVAEAPRNWLAAPASAVGESAPPPFEARPAAVPEPALPESLDAFQAWLASGPIPGASPSSARVGPAGDPASGLMILIDMPSLEDAAAGRLLTGEAGALFDRMMHAIHRSRETLYLASLSPVRSATGRLDAAGAGRLASLARHHVGLVRPRALLLFGDACAKALLGAGVAQARGKWHELDTPTGKISTLVTIRPEKLLVQPGLKKLAWEDLQMLEGLEP